MVRLTEDEENWLKNNYPKLSYDRERSVIYGPFSIYHCYKNKPSIKATFEIEVRLWLMKSRNEYPISEYFPRGFYIEDLFPILSSFFYWVAYYERYDEAPWVAERHGSDARIEYYIEKGDIETIRRIYKIKLGFGIAKSKLRNYLKSEALKNQLIKKLLS